MSGFGGRSYDGLLGASALSYDDASGTYAAPLDPVALPSLPVKTCRDLGFVRSIPVIMGHGYGGSYTDWTLADRQNAAKRGMCSIFPDGRPTRDGGGRDNYDYFGALAYARATFGGAVSQTRSIMAGVSGGAFHAALGACRFLDRFTGYACAFPLTDPGYDATYGWWNQVDGSTQALIASYTGSHADVDTTNYRARNVVESIAYALASSPVARLWFGCDSSDTTVPNNHSTRMRDALVAAGVPHYFVQTTFGSTYRLVHDYPHNSPGVESAYDEWFPILSNLPPWNLPHVGELRILGYAHPKDFFVMTAEASTLDPDTGYLADGGGRRVVHLRYDLEAGTFDVDPLNGSCWVQVIFGSKRISANVTTRAVLTPV